MPVPDGERLAALEQIASNLRDGLGEIRLETLRTRGRLHELEKVTAGLLELQQSMHRANESRLRRLSLSIQWGGLAMAAGMFALALATFLAHH